MHLRLKSSTEDRLESRGDSQGGNQQNGDTRSLHTLDLKVVTPILTFLSPFHGKKIITAYRPAGRKHA
jgi:hypothetical protein